MSLIEYYNLYERVKLQKNIKPRVKHVIWFSVLLIKLLIIPIPLSAIGQEMEMA